MGLRVLQKTVSAVRAAAVRKIAGEGETPADRYLYWPSGSAASESPWGCWAVFSLETTHSIRDSTMNPVLRRFRPRLDQASRGMPAPGANPHSGLTFGIDQYRSFGLGDDGRMLCNVYGMEETALARMDLREGETDAHALFQKMSGINPLVLLALTTFTTAKSVRIMKAVSFSTSMLSAAVPAPASPPLRRSF